MYKGFKYRIYPNEEQKDLILKHIGCSRWIYNYALNKKTESYQQTGKGLSRFDIQKDIPKLKKNEETFWLKEVNSQTLQTSLEHMDKAFTKFFKEKKGYPKYKSKKHNKQTFSIPQNTYVNFDEGNIKLPKFKDPIKCILHRKFIGNIRTSTITKTPTEKYFISILVELPEEPPKKKPIDENQAIGIDLGVKTFATLSNGIKIENPRHLKISIKKVKKLQRQVSKKINGSNNKEKSIRRLALLHEKITNKRLNFLHKTAHYLTNNFNTLCLETLKSGNMIKNHKLAQAINDIAIGKFNEIIDYKCEWIGTNILRIGEFEPSSKMCSCGIINKKLKLSQRIWTCNSCGITHDRDILAANNIKRFAFTKNNTAGTAGIHACGDMNEVSHSAQEA
jgi:putative transposase